MSACHAAKSEGEVAFRFLFLDRFWLWRGCNLMQSGRRLIETWDLAEALEGRGVLSLKIKETHPTATRAGGVSDA